MKGLSLSSNFLCAILFLSVTLPSLAPRPEMHTLPDRLLRIHDLHQLGPFDKERSKIFAPNSSTSVPMCGLLHAIAALFFYPRVQNKQNSANERNERPRAPQAENTPVWGKVGSWFTTRGIV